MRSRVAAALRHKAFLLFADDRRDEAIVVYDAAIARFGEATEPELLDVLANTMLDKGKALFTEQRFEQAIETFDTLVVRFAHADDPALRNHTVVALNNKVAALNQLSQQEEAIATHHELVSGFGDAAIAAFDDLIRQFINAAEPQQREQLAGALSGKTALLSELSRPAEAIATLTQLINRFENDDIGQIQQVVALSYEVRDQLLEDQSGND